MEFSAGSFAPPDSLRLILRNISHFFVDMRCKKLLTTSVNHCT